MSNVVAPITQPQIDAVCADLDGAHKQRWKTAFPIRPARASSVHRVLGGSLAGMIIKLGFMEKLEVTFTAFSSGTPVDGLRAPHPALRQPTRDSWTASTDTKEPQREPRATVRNSLAENKANVACMAIAWREGRPPSNS